MSGTYGPDHPMVASYVTNLGMVPYDSGHLASVKASFERVLRIFKMFLLEGHRYIKGVEGNLDGMTDEG